MSETHPSSNRRYLRQAWLVIVLAVCYGGALAGVAMTLGPKIAENKKSETYDKIPDLVPGADQSRTVERMVADAAGNERRIYEAISSDGRRLGWVVPAGGQGFCDRIELLIGLNADSSKITGLYVLEQKETPGLGAYIVGDDFQTRFRDAPTSPALVAVKQDPASPSEIRAITGATISSESVATIVNEAIAKLKDAMRKVEG